MPSLLDIISGRDQDKVDVVEIDQPIKRPVFAKGTDPDYRYDRMAEFNNLQSYEDEKVNNKENIFKSLMNTIADNNLVSGNAKILPPNYSDNNSIDLTTEPAAVKVQNAMASKENSDLKKTNAGLTDNVKSRIGEIEMLKQKLAVQNKAIQDKLGGMIKNASSASLMKPVESVATSAAGGFGSFVDNLLGTPKDQTGGVEKAMKNITSWISSELSPYDTTTKRRGAMNTMMGNILRQYDPAMAKGWDDYSDAQKERHLASIKMDKDDQRRLEDITLKILQDEANATRTSLENAKKAKNKANEQTQKLQQELLLKNIDHTYKMLEENNLSEKDILEQRNKINTMTGSIKDKQIMLEEFDNRILKIRQKQVAEQTANDPNADPLKREKAVVWLKNNS